MGKDEAMSNEEFEKHDPDDDFAGRRRRGLFDVDDEDVDFVGDTEDEDETHLSSDDKDLSNEYPTMDDEGNLKKVLDDDPVRNMLSPEHEQKREELINKRIGAFRRDARFSAFSDEEAEDMCEALEKELKGQMLDELANYNPHNQTDFHRLKFRVEERLGRNIKTDTGETQEEMLARHYPSMSTNPRKAFRHALGLED